jgi:signal transduction histidine kinase
MTHATSTALLTALAGIAAATAYVFLGLTGIAAHPATRAHAWLFTVMAFAVAWMTGVTSLFGLLNERFPPIHALSPLFSGYGPAALLLFTSHTLQPRTPLKLRWLALGMPGTAFSILTLARPEHLAFLTYMHREDVVAWHPILSPVYLLHLSATVAAVLTSGALAIHGLFTTAPGSLHRAVQWLAATHIIGALGLFLYGLLPAVLGWMWLLPVAAPLLGLPTLALLYRALQTVHDAASIPIRAETAQKQLEQLAHALGSMSRRMDAALTEVVTQTEAMRRVHVPRRERDSRLRRIQSIATDAQRSTGRLLRLAEPAPTPLPSTPILATLRTLLPSLVVEDALLVRLHADDEAEAAAVACDREGLASAILALADNARRAAHPGAHPAVDLRVTVERPARVEPLAFGANLQGQDALRIDVIDRGVGMTPETLERALVPFYSSRVDGNGLGLVDVASLVRRSGGALWMRSELQTGTTVTLWLPLAETPHLPRPSTDTDHVADPLQPATLVTDDVAFAEAMALLLDARDVPAAALPTGLASRRFSVRQPEVQALLIDVRGGSPQLLTVIDAAVARLPRATVWLYGARPQLSQHVRAVHGARIRHLRAQEGFAVIAGVLARACATGERQQQDCGRP